MENQPLAGRTVAVPETREIDIFAAMLERRGARVVRCPMVAIRDAPDPAPVLQWSRDLAAGSFDDLILLTGEGLRRILGCVERNEPALKESFVAALERMRKITRGPKPARWRPPMDFGDCNGSRQPGSPSGASGADSPRRPA